MHDEEREEWPQRIRVGEQSVRDGVKKHIEDPKAGGRGRFIRQCPPPGDQTGMPCERSPEVPTLRQWWVNSHNWDAGHETTGGRNRNQKDVGSGIRDTTAERWNPPKRWRVSGERRQGAARAIRARLMSDVGCRVWPSTTPAMGGPIDALTSRLPTQGLPRATR